MALLFSCKRDKLSTIVKRNRKGSATMTQISRAAEYRYFYFTGFYFGKVSFGLAENAGSR